MIDGDTFWWRGRKVRIEGIDAAEVQGAQCPAELALGLRAIERLAELLNQGGWRLVQQGSRDVDQFGRQLRTVNLGDTNIGQILIDEGLARPRTAKRRPWC